MKRKIFYMFLAFVLVFSNAAAVFAQDVAPDRFEGRELPASIEALKLDSPVQVEGQFDDVLDRALMAVDGVSRVIIRLSADSGAEAFAKGLDSVNAKANA